MWQCQQNHGLTVVKLNMVMQSSRGAKSENFSCSIT